MALWLAWLPSLQILLLLVLDVYYRWSGWWRDRGLQHLFFDKIKIDDPVGALSVHGTVGIFGVMVVCVTGGASVGGQLVGLLTIFVWVFVTSLITWFIIKAIMGIRVSEEEEYEGVDLAECGMEAYPEFVSQN